MEFIREPPGLVMQPPEGCLCKWTRQWWGSEMGEVLVLSSHDIHRRCPHHGWKRRWAKDAEDN